MASPAGAHRSGVASWRSGLTFRSCREAHAVGIREPCWLARNQLWRGGRRTLTTGQPTSSNNSPICRRNADSLGPAAANVVVCIDWGKTNRACACFELEWLRRMPFGAAGERRAGGAAGAWLGKAGELLGHTAGTSHWASIGVDSAGARRDSRCGITALDAAAAGWAWPS